MHHSACQDLQACQQLSGGRYGQGKHTPSVCTPSVQQAPPALLVIFACLMSDMWPVDISKVSDVDRIGYTDLMPSMVVQTPCLQESWVSNKYGAVDLILALQPAHARVVRYILLVGHLNMPDMLCLQVSKNIVCVFTVNTISCVDTHVTCPCGPYVAFQTG